MAADTSDISQSSLLEKASGEVCRIFGFPSLYPKQTEALRHIFSKRDVFVNLPTCYGKSLVFQAVPIMSDILLKRSKGESTMVVISPLKALMEDQVRYLKKLNIPAVYITDEHGDVVVQKILNGEFSHVYGSPECFLTSTWRGIFSSKKFRESLVCVAVDEAHCITQWGLPGAGKGKVPFRKWYGNLGEMRSLIPDSVKLIVVTATAMRETRASIYDSLKLSKDTAVVAESPDRTNLFYCVQYVDKDVSLELLFSTIVKEIQAERVNATRTLIYCQTRKQCAILYRVFEVALGVLFFKGSSANPKNRVVEMYHAGTPKAVKKHISKNLAKTSGHIRVLISTIAFGMGIDCKEVTRIIHFGPSKNTECYVQESGCAGRNGARSECILLFNGILSSHCSADMKSLLNDDITCRRQILIAAFGFQCADIQPKHNCCDNCVKICKCAECPAFIGLLVPEELSVVPDSGKTRPVSADHKKILKSKLKSYRNSLINEHTTEVTNTVSLPSVLMEFGHLQIKEILNNCHKIFTLQDVQKYVEVWRKHHAYGVLQAIKDVFEDIEEVPEYTDEQYADELLADMDWGDVRNDSSLLSMMQSQDLEEMESQDQDDSGEISQNSTGYLQALCQAD